LLLAHAKLPSHVLLSTLQGADTKGQRQIPQIPTNIQPTQEALRNFRALTPTAEDVEGDSNRDYSRSSESKPKSGRGKNVNWKEKEDGNKDKDKNGKSNDTAIINDSSLGQALSREIRKTEESLHTRIGRLIGKEMDKQRESTLVNIWYMSYNTSLHKINGLRIPVPTSRRKILPVKKKF